MFLASFFPLFSNFLPFSCKKNEKNISTSIWRAPHPNTDRYIQQSSFVIYNWLGTYPQTLPFILIETLRSVKHFWRREIFVIFNYFIEILDFQLFYWVIGLFYIFFTSPVEKCQTFIAQVFSLFIRQGFNLLALKGINVTESVFWTGSIAGLILLLGHIIWSLSGSFIQPSTVNINLCF